MLYTSNLTSVFQRRRQYVRVSRLQVNNYNIVFNSQYCFIIFIDAEFLLIKAIYDDWLNYSYNQ